eukprot:gene11869-5196_t
MYEEDDDFEDYLKEVGSKFMKMFLDQKESEETKPRSCVVLKIVGKDCILIKVTTTKIHSKNHPQYAFCIPVSENPSDKDTLKCIGKLKYDPSYLYINKITTIDTTEQVTIDNKSKDCVQLKK